MQKTTQFLFHTYWLRFFIFSRNRLLHVANCQSLFLSQWFIYFFEFQLIYQLLLDFYKWFLCNYFANPHSTMQRKKIPTFPLNFVSKIEKTIARFSSNSNWRNGILKAEAYERRANGIQFVKPKTNNSEKNKTKT